jgi:glycosyltransferase involved in cell wall biosynthesis
MLNLARTIDPARFLLRIVAIGPADELATDLPPSTEVALLNASRLRAGLPRLVSVLRRAKPDVVVCTLGYINLALLALRPLIGGNVRMVVREANVVSATLRAMPGFLPSRRLYAWLYPRAAAIIAQTDEIAAEIAALAPDAKSRVEILPNPVDEVALRSRAAVPVRSPGDGLRLVAAGRLTHQKGFDRLVALMRDMAPSTELTIYGEGPDRASLEQQIARLGLGDRVSLPGFSSSLSAAIAGADLFVLPSRWEGVPNVVLEALALGTPVVASDDARIQDVAREASSAAVTIASVGAAFVAAVGVHQPNPAAALRPSLLPKRYRAETVAARFADLLTRVACSPA